MIENKTYAMPLLKRSKNARLAVVSALLVIPLAVAAILTWQWTWMVWAGLGAISGGIVGVLLLLYVGVTTLFWVTYWVKTGRWLQWKRFDPWGDGGENDW